MGSLAMFPEPASDNTLRTRSVGRALDLVKLLLGSNEAGLRLTEFVALSGCSKTTVHRLLQELVASGLVTRDNHDRFRLGHLAYELGVRASNELNYNLQDLCGPGLSAIAEETGETVYLGIRSGPTGLFTVDRKFENRTACPVGPPRGMLYPLGVAAGGLAILSSLPTDERRHIIESNRSRLRQYGGLSQEGLADLVEQTRSDGFSYIENGTVPGVASVGTAILGVAGRPMVGVSVAAPVSRMTGAHRRAIQRALASQAGALRSVLIKNFGSLVGLLQQ